MNLFYLDQDLDKCAEYHVDKHIVKMQLEAAQLITPALWVDHALGYIPRALDKEERRVIDDEKATLKVLDARERAISPYLPSFYNHPCSIWVRTSLDNFEWTYAYVGALNSEYGYRYGGKSHKSAQVINELQEPKNLPRIGLTPHAQAMPDELKRQDAILAYRDFYMLDKAVFASWKYRNRPDWWDDSIADYERRISGR